MTPQLHKPSTETAVFRNDKTYWVLAALLALVALVFPFAIYQSPQNFKTRADVWGLAGLCAVMGLVAVGCAWFAIRCRAIVTLKGITFVGFWRQRFIPWAAIEDYELRVVPNEQAKFPGGMAFLKVGGKWLRLPRTNYLPYDVFLERIAAEAKWSVTRSWQRSDLRDDSIWPKTFDYPYESGWKLAGITALIFVLFTINTLSKAMSSGLASMLSGIAMIWSGLSWWGRVGFALAPFLAPGLYAMMIWAQYPAILTRRRFRDQKIVATLEGLTYSKDGIESFLAWGEIQSFHLETLPGNLQPTLKVI